jgi:NAD(P)-dependent dehydrogenase (short-subunit alcohol dehydrogenase family)
MDHLRDKVAVVTEAGSGVGSAIAVALAARGARIVAVDIGDDRLAHAPARRRRIAPPRAGLGRLHRLPDIPRTLTDTERRPPMTDTRPEGLEVLRELLPGIREDVTSLRDGGVADELAGYPAADSARKLAHEALRRP